MEVDTFCARHAVVPWHAQKVIVRIYLTGEARDSGWAQTRSERAVMNSLVPFLPVLQGRIGLSHALNATGICPDWQFPTEL